MFMFHSTELLRRAQYYLPGGVNSPVRAFNGVGGDPIFFSFGQGAYVTDVDNKKYIDYLNSWGTLILGHTYPSVINAVQAAAEKGLSYGMSTELEVLLAEKICKLMPNIEMIRMVNSGTEATMSAVRLARAHTGRNKILKFNGCYHGHSDALLVQAGSGISTLGLPSSAGIPETIVQHTMSVDFNDLEQVEKIFSMEGHDIAAVIVEPIAGNMSCVLPVPGFLEGLRKLCSDYESLLIFDEVITGFRVSLGGAQAYYQVKPDLTTLGKIIGGGLPIGAFGGCKTIMKKIAPLGPVYQAGTMSGNPIAMAAGLATLNEVSRFGFYEGLHEKTKMLMEGFLTRSKAAGIPFIVNYLGGMFGFFFSDENKIYNYEQVKRCHLKRFQNFFHAMLAHSVYFAPSMYESGFISNAHGKQEIQITLNAAEKVFQSLS